MAVSRLLFCAASLAVLDLKMFANASTNTLTFENKELEGCLASLNTARGAAGLEALEKGDDLLNSLEYGQGLGKAICEFVESGFSLFEQTPPETTKVGDYVKDPKALSFLTLDDQWQKIAKVFSSSASSTVPSLFAVAAVLAAASLL
ncbi:hypothetical protein Emed_002086 [Eimeria media]